MRIGIDARLAWRRGVGVYTANLLLALSRTDPYNEYHVFSAPPELRKALPSRRFHFVDPSDHGTAPLLKPFARHPAFYEQWWMPTQLERLGLDLLHYTDNSATLVAGVPFVVTVHDTMFLRPLKDSYPRSTMRQWLVDRYKKLVAPSAQAAKAVITVSESSRKDIVRDLGVPGERVWVTPEGVDPKAFFPLKRRKKHDLPTVMVHGAEDERKNLGGVLRCARILRERGKRVRWDILGMDEARMRRSGWASKVREWGLEPFVRLKGDVPWKDLRSAYHEADLLLHVSRWEGFGLPVLEAFACGVPVVVSDAKSLPEVAGNAALAVSPDSPESMADAVLRVLTRPLTARTLVRKGLARAKQFTWDRTARMTVEAYQKAALSKEYDKQGRRIGADGE